MGVKNFSNYEEDLKDLIQRGGQLQNSMQISCFPNEFDEALKKKFKTKKERDKFLKTIPDFNEGYQEWYSEAVALISQVMPDRADDFIRLYQKPKNRKSIEYGNYVMEDYLQGLQVTDGWSGEVKVNQKAAISQFEQQLNIVKAVKKRFKSTLFDIKTLVHAELLDSELDAARELLKKGYSRAAGVLAGVVLEAHLSQVLDNHKIKSGKKNPAISDYNDVLKKEGIIETKEWRKIQHLADLRNLCGHKKPKDPSHDDVDDLIAGTEKITKNIF